MRRYIAWGVVVLTTVAFALDTIFTAAHRPLLSEATWADHGWPLSPLAGTGYAVMGALIISRYPRHRLGWLLSGASLLSVTLAAEAYSMWVLDGGGPGSPSWAHVAAWAGPLLGWPAFTAQIFVFLLAPDGHLASRRWRWAAWVAAAGLVLHTLGTLSVHPGEVVVGEDFGNRALSLPLLTVGWVLVAVALIASVVSLVVRLRRAEGDERLQLLWIASAAALLALGVVCILAIPRIQGEEGTWLAALPLRVAQAAVPVCVAIAVLRHRLIAIDLVLNRALVFALATGLVAVGYVAVVVLVGLAVDGRTDGFWPSLVATAVVALAFQPLRRRVVRLADRLAFGAAAAPYEALAELSRRLGESPDPADLLPAVADAAGRAVNARHVRAKLDVEAGPDEVATWSSQSAGAVDGERVDVPVVDRGERLGSIEVTMSPGHALRPVGRRLLLDLAEQASLAFRSARLAAELSGEVERLGRRTGDLADSRRRLIHAGDAERSRLERAIDRQVVPYLAPLPDRLDRLALADASPTERADGLTSLQASLDSALVALREITRGVFPAQLARSGLATALGSLVARAGETGRLVVEESAAAARRFPAPVEAAAYFCAAETTRDIDDPTVVVAVRDDRLSLVVTGTDRGAMAREDIRDRVEAAGGTLVITSTNGKTVVDVQLPVHAAVSRSGPNAALVT
jgi:signal transduction histidine kinase